MSLKWPIRVWAREPLHFDEDLIFLWGETCVIFLIKSTVNFFFGYSSKSCEIQIQLFLPIVFSFKLVSKLHICSMIYNKTMKENYPSQEFGPIFTHNYISIFVRSLPLRALRWSIVSSLWKIFTNYIKMEAICCCMLPL